MNLRISNSQLRFRINNSELEQLIAGQTVTMLFNHGNGIMEYVVKAENQETPIIFKAANDSWQFCVDRSGLQNLATSLPSRDGIEHETNINGNAMTLVLEVDVRRNRQ